MSVKRLLPSVLPHELRLNSSTKVLKNDCEIIIELYLPLVAQLGFYT